MAHPLRRSRRLYQLIPALEARGQPNTSRSRKRRSLWSKWRSDQGIIRIEEYGVRNRRLLFHLRLLGDPSARPARYAEQTRLEAGCNGYHRLNLDAPACVVGYRGLEEEDGAALPLALHYLAEGDLAASRRFNRLNVKVEQAE